MCECVCVCECECVCVRASTPRQPVQVHLCYRSDRLEIPAEPEREGECVRERESSPSAHPGKARRCRANLIRTSICDKYSGSLKLLHTRIIFAIVKQHQVQIYRIDAKYSLEILDTIKSGKNKTVKPRF